MSVFTNYRIEVDCLLTWFPVRHSASLQEPRIRADTFSYRADDEPFASGNRAGRFIGQALGGPQDGLDSRNLVRSITETGVDTDQVFFMDLEVGIGARVRKRRLSLEAGTTTPFLITLHAAQTEDQELSDTAVAFQGVVTAGRRRSGLIYAAARVLSLAVGIPLKRGTSTHLITDHSRGGAARIESGSGTNEPGSGGTTIER
jgi:hypothetical protein